MLKFCGEPQRELFFERLGLSFALARAVSSATTRVNPVQDVPTLPGRTAPLQCDEISESLFTWSSRAIPPRNRIGLLAR